MSLILFEVATVFATSGHDGNRYAYLEESDPFYVDGTFPKLTTPQWEGEPGVEAVVILAIDDMRTPEKYETVLRPILERLKKIDGRAPVSIMSRDIDPANPQYRAWLKEGLSIEVHTLAHPCPLLAKGNLAAAAETYHRCVDLVKEVSGNAPVAFRMPCCDSINSPSPRFYAEIFNDVTSRGNFLQLDSSVMNVFTPKDPELAKESVTDANGREKFRKYLPFPSFVTTIENYPYPYVIGRLCWEFPAMAPSDWEAQHLHGTNNPVTVADWKSGLDAVVRKQGTFTFIFHPHGWIRPEQMVEFVDYAVEKYGSRVKFLNFREAAERLQKNLLAGRTLRDAHGVDNGVRLLDLNNDGYLDVVVAGSSGEWITRIWDPRRRAWDTTRFPTALVKDGAAGKQERTGAVFGLRHDGAEPFVLVRNETEAGAWRFRDGQWTEDRSLLSGLELDGKPLLTASHGLDRGVRLRDLDRDGATELLVANPEQNAIFKWSEPDQSWRRLEYRFPSGVQIADEQGRDAGARFYDFNGDGYDDLLFSNADHYSLHLFVAKKFLGFDEGWSRVVSTGKRGDFGEIPMIVRSGEHSSNGAWIKEGHLWVQNEDTAALPDLVDRRSFTELLAGLQPPAKSPRDSLASIQVRPGFEVELVANEPMVKDPIALEWGADGKLWVVEMGDYPLGIDNQGKPGGIIRYLEDTDGDGRYDKSTIFLEGLNFPTGVYPWGKGVIVSAAPEIFYAEDTDGDGKADQRITLFRGFREGNQQHRCNGFDYGLDHWLYGANGDSGGVVEGVQALLRSGNPRVSGVDLRGHDFRIAPDSGGFEAIEGQTQYGRHRDDWGNWFANDNPVWLWQYYVPERYLKRNPSLAVRSLRRDLANYTDSTRVFAISRSMQRFNDIGALNHVTSANSPMPYRDDLFGPDFAASIFISEPVHNVVHREVLEEAGASFTSHRASDEESREFLASTDNWFRPTMLKTGPDGALYIADMYRLVIEHPEWIPADTQKHLDLRAGHDKGRIYRVYPKGAMLRPVPRLDRLDTAGLVAAMESPNGWQRDTVQRLLVHKRDAGAGPLLVRLLESSRFPKTRLQALATLAGLDLVTPPILVKGLRDAHPAVRAEAIRLAEPILAGRRTFGRQEIAALENELTGAVSDSSAKVRYQLAFSFGEWKERRAAVALAEIAERDRADADVQLAVMSSLRPHLWPVAEELMKRSSAGGPPEPLLDQLITMAVIEKEDFLLAKMVRWVSQPPGAGFGDWQFKALAAVLSSLEKQQRSWDALAMQRDGAWIVAAAEPLFARARELAGASGADPAMRMAAVDVLGHRSQDRQADLNCFANLLSPQNSVDLQKAALHALAGQKDPAAAELLRKQWHELGPEIRGEALNLFLARAAWTEVLLRAMERGEIPSGQLDTVRRQKLLSSTDSKVRERAGRLLQQARPDRKSVLREYQVVESLPGDSQKGAVLFRQNCSTCHRLRGEGNEVGPDLGAVANKSIAALLESILDPNQAVEVRYLGYSAELKDGRELSGVIVSETPNSLTLRLAGGKDEVLLRSELEVLRGTGLSLMPEGFEASLKPQDIADLIAYVRGQ